MDVDSGIENPELEDPEQREKGAVVQKVQMDVYFCITWCLYVCGGWIM